MRVIAGKYKGRKLILPKDKRIRPTSDRVKEAVFGILGSRVADAQVLDLFAGCGSLGIEALSRGAKSATFVDSNPKCIKAIRENLEYVLGGEKNCARHSFSKNKKLCLAQFFHVARADAGRAIRRFGTNTIKFDIIILDPPYYKGLVKKCLQAIDSCGIIANSGLVLAEHSKRDELPEEIGSLRLMESRKYSNTGVSIYENIGSISR